MINLKQMKLIKSYIIYYIYLFFLFIINAYIDINIDLIFF